MVDILRKIEDITTDEDYQIYNLIEQKSKLLYISSKIYNNIQEIIELQHLSEDTDYADYILEYKAEITYLIIVALKTLQVKPSNIFNVNYTPDSNNVYSLLEYPVAVFEGYKTSRESSYINNLMCILKSVVTKKNIYNIYKYLKKEK